MEKLFGDNLVIIYFIVGLSVICYGNFKVAQKVMLMYTITYLCCLLDVLDSKPALLMITILLFIYLEYLTEDYYKLKIFKKIRYKLVDGLFLIFFQYHYALFITAVVMQTYLVRSLIDLGPYNEICISISIILAIFSVHEVSMQKFEMESVTQIMKVFEKHPVYLFPYDDIDQEKYYILTELEDKSYFERKNSYNFLSIEFIRYRWNRFRQYISAYQGKERFRRTASAMEHYVLATKHIRGYSTIEMQLMRNVGLHNGYNCVIRRKIFEFLYSKIFLSSLKDYFIDNYYSNRQHYKEYLLWVYFRVVKIRINGVPVQPASKAFTTDKMQDWSNESVFIACMGLSNKGEEYYDYQPYCNIICNHDLEEKKLRKMYRSYPNERLK